MCSVHPVLSADSTPARATPGVGALAFRLRGDRTVLSVALARSPLRLLDPRNHGDAAWVYLANLGGGLVDGDRLAARVDVGPGASAFVGTQATTKVYRSPRGCSQRVDARVDEGGALSLAPDPVVCFAGARYAQSVDVTLAEGASLLLVDGYTCGRSARGERWAFARYASRTIVRRGGQAVLVDATRLEAAEGSIAERMGRFDVIMSIAAFGPKFAPVRDAMLAERAAPAAGDEAIASASPIRADGAIVRVAAAHYRAASRVLRPSFAALAAVLGDDPFCRKW